jgi:hypothetical protein
MVNTSHSNYVRGKARGPMSRLAPAKKHKTLPKNKLKLKRGKVMAQEVECLPSKLKALSSNPTTTKKKILIAFF